MSSKTPILYSLGIPAFKGRYLKECITSILNQTYSNFELIIVNDKSPDDLDTIVAEYLTDPRVKYFKNEVNTGAEKVVNNWNKCLDQATGEFFLLMGDDDRLEVDFLQEFDTLIAKYPDLDVYHCRTKIIDEDSKPIKLTPSCPEFESVYDNIWHRVNGMRVQFISDFLYRTSTLKQRGGYYYLPLAWASDDISAYIGCGTKGIAHTNKPVFNYRTNRYNISNTGNRELKMSAILQQKQWFDDFLATEPGNSQDRIIWEDLRRGIRKYIQKKKIMTISRSLHKSFFSNVFKWYSLRKKYDFSFSELAFAILDSLKTRKVKSSYDGN